MFLRPVITRRICVTPWIDRPASANECWSRRAISRVDTAPPFQSPVRLMAYAMELTGTGVRPFLVEQPR